MYTVRILHIINYKSLNWGLKKLYINVGFFSDTMLARKKKTTRIPDFN